MCQSLTNWFSGLFANLLGVYHIVLGGPTISRWLHTATPPIPDQGIITGRLGFELGGYPAVAIGLTFMMLGSRLPSTYDLFWTIAFFTIGGLPVYSFQSFHVSNWFGCSPFCWAPLSSLAFLPLVGKVLIETDYWRTKWRLPDRACSRRGPVSWSLAADLRAEQRRGKWSTPHVESSFF